MKPLVRLISWDAESVSTRAKALATSFRVDASPLDSSRLVGRIAELAPAAVVIDLERKPSHGKAVGVVLRKSKSTREIPLVFAGGSSEKAVHIQGDLPGAVFTPWAKAGAAVKRAIANPPVIRGEPKSYMDQFAGRTLVKKLDLKHDMNVALIGAPDGFIETLGDVPEGVDFREQPGRGVNMALWFVRSAAELEEEIDFLSARLDGASLWIVYPKRSGNLRADFTQHDVRRAANRVGMVDYKICSVDDDWSGMKFGRRVKT